MVPGDGPVVSAHLGPTDAAPDTSPQWLLDLHPASAPSAVVSRGAAKGTPRAMLMASGKARAWVRLASGPQELPCRPLPLATSTPRLPWALQHLCPQVVNAGQVAHGTETPSSDTGGP